MTSREIVKERKNKLKQKFKNFSLIFSAFIFFSTSFAIVYFVVEKIKNDSVTNTIERINKRIDDSANNENGLFNAYKKSSTDLVTQISIGGNNVPWLKLEKGSYDDLKTNPNVDAQIINKKILDEAFVNKFPASDLSNPIGDRNKWYLLESKGISTTELLDELNQNNVISKELFENFLGNYVDETKLEQFTNTGIGTLSFLEASEQLLTTQLSSLQTTLNDYIKRSQINTRLNTKAEVDYSYIKPEVDSKLPINENNVDNTFIARVTDQIDSPIFTTKTVTPTKDYVDLATDEIKATDYDSKTNQRERILNKLGDLEDKYELVWFLRKVKKIKSRMVDRNVGVIPNRNTSSCDSLGTIAQILCRQLAKRTVTSCSDLHSYTLKNWLNQFIRSGDPQYTDNDMALIYKYENYFTMKWDFYTDTFNSSYSAITVYPNTYTWTTSGSLSGCGSYSNYQGNLNSSWTTHLEKGIHINQGTSLSNIRIWMSYKRSDRTFRIAAHNQNSNASNYKGYFKKFYLDINWSSVYNNNNMNGI